MNSEASRIAAAYDAIASHYDSQLISAQWIRDRLWERMDALFPIGSRVLDVTAGTGLDALHLVERGVSVVACDVSSAMLFQLHDKNPNIETHVVDFNELDLNEEFDGVISTFAGVNTSPDLRPFAKSAAQLLRPGGILLIHVLNRWSLLDFARQFVRLRWSANWQTMVSSQRDVKLGSILVPHYLYSPLSLYRRVFKPYFRMCSINGQGIIRPLEVGWGKRLEDVERRLAPTFPFHSLGIFFSIEMSRA